VEKARLEGISAALAGGRAAAGKSFVAGGSNGYMPAMVGFYQSNKHRVQWHHLRLKTEETGLLW